MDEHTGQDGTATTEHRVQLPDGRVVAVSETGPSEGPVVVLCHSAPGSRRFDPDPAATARSGVRLVTADRAGYGASTALPEGEVPTVAGYADDLAVALAELGITGVGVAGWSAGGRVALALGARHPALVRAVALVATPAPHEDVPWIPDEYIAMMDALRADLPGATGALTGVFAELAADPAAAVDDVAVGPADEAALAADPSRRRRLDAMLTEAFAPGAAGLAADIVSYTLVPWGFDPMSVGAPTSGFYGAEDTHVTPAHGDWYAERVPDADLRIVPGIAHLVVMTAWPEILSVVA